MHNSWVENDKPGEMKSYQNLAIDYFYFGDMKKAEFYYDRYLRGKTENDNSIIKKNTIGQILLKRQQKANGDTTRF